MDWFLCSTSKGCCNRNECCDELFQDSLSKGVASSSSEGMSPEYKSGWSRHVQGMFKTSKSEEKAIPVVSSRPVLPLSPFSDKVTGYREDQQTCDAHPAVVAASDALPSEREPLPRCITSEGGLSEESLKIMHRIGGPSTTGPPKSDGMMPLYPSAFPERPKMCPLSRHVWDRLELLFSRMDSDASGTVTREKAIDFVNAYRRVCTTQLGSQSSMYELVNENGAITANSFIQFWLLLRENGCGEDAILEEVENILRGGSWRDWKDLTEIDASSKTFPSRPTFCRLSSAAWNLCAELWENMADGSDTITREDAMRFFKGGFSTVSTETMFSEVDVMGNGFITPSEFMAFWVHVSGLGYSDKAIMEEVNLLLQGGTWLDWTSDQRLGYESTDSSFPR